MVKDVAVFRPDDGKKLPYIADDSTVYHEKASGLQLRLRPSGARTWVVRYWSPAKQSHRYFKLGDPAKMKLATARDAAKRRLIEVEDGKDPFAEKRALDAQEQEERKLRAVERKKQQQDRARRRIGFGQLCEQYIHWRSTELSGRHSRVARPNTVANYNSILERHIRPTIGSIPPEDLTRSDIRKLLERAIKKEFGGPTMGPRVKDFVKGVWTWLGQREEDLGIKLPTDSPLRGLLPTGAIKSERDRVLSTKEVWRLWRATEGDLHGEALRLMLLTGCRVSEATKLTWSEISFEEKLWKLPAERNKSVRDRKIPLSPQAVALLRRVEERSDGERVFGHISRIYEAVLRARTAMRVFDWNAQDLRRTCATRSGELTKNPFVPTLILGHRDKNIPAVTRVYDRGDYIEPVRAALNDLGQWVEKTVSSKKEPGVVIPMDAARA